MTSVPPAPSAPSGVDDPDDLEAPSVPGQPTDPADPTVDANEELVVSADEVSTGLFPRILDRLAAVSVEGWISFAVVAGCALIILMVAGPSQILVNHTPTGGDMGAHVWGPDWLMHHLLPKGRLSGWTPDWYDGFPAYQYYMVVPSLFIVALATGIHNAFLAILAVGAGLGVAVSGYVRPGLHKWRRLLLALGLVVVVLSIPIPYNIAFKMVTILGLITLPAASWAFGKLADFPFPTPPLLAIAATFYIFNRSPIYNNTGTIVGGNFASTMAGEFAFSIALSFGVLYLGFLIRGLRTGRHRGITVVLLMLTATCHIIPTFYVLGATVLIFVVRPGWARLKWLATSLPVAGLLSSFWLVPFVLRRAWANDMGWEKLPGGLKVLEGVRSHWFYKTTYQGNTLYGVWYYLRPHSMNVVIVLAAAGVIVSIINGRREGVALGLCVLVLLFAFELLPDAQLWNARILPFLYLCYYFLAAIAIGEVVHAIAVLATPGPEPFRPISLVAAPVLAVVAGIAILLPLNMMPGSHRGTDGVMRWPAYGNSNTDSLFQVSVKDDDPVGGWATWNFSGLQGKTQPQEGDATSSKPGQYVPWTEYKALIDTMAKLGKDPKNGCGRAMWEYDGTREGTYGTPMALMMLPYFTKSCIGSMEGLYFESSGTTPFHFINQTELSTVASSTQRYLPYNGVNFPQGIKHLQLLGVKYYLADTRAAVSFADQQPQLEKLAVSGPWHIYRVSESQLVTPLTAKPVVMTNIADSQNSWLGPAMNWYIDPNRWGVFLANKGPADWARITVKKTPAPKRAEGDPRPTFGSLDTLPAIPRRPVTPAKVSNIKTTDDGISFDVDRVGVPVLVKVSYFPNWQANGAKGPWRVTPNLMVVVPTSKHVSLHYGRTYVDYLAIILTLVGLALLILLFRSPPLAMPEPRRPFHDWLERRAAERQAAAGPPGAINAEGAEDAEDAEGWPAGATSVPPPAPPAADQQDAPDPAEVTLDPEDPPPAPAVPAT